MPLSNNPLVKPFFWASSFVKKKDPLFVDIEIEPDKRLDAYQKRAMYSDSTRNVVTAGAGSVKTHVLTKRVAMLLKKGLAILQLMIDFKGAKDVIRLYENNVCTASLLCKAKVLFEIGKYNGLRPKIDYKNKQCKNQALFKRLFDA